jgi:hypothetical protein
MVFLRPLKPDARELLSRPLIDQSFNTVRTGTMINAERMRSLPRFFVDIPDPRRTSGRRHKLSTVLAIAAGAVLCGMRGYKAMSDLGKQPWSKGA